MTFKLSGILHYETGQPKQMKLRSQVCYPTLDTWRRGAYRYISIHTYVCMLLLILCIETFA